MRETGDRDFKKKGEEGKWWRNIGMRRVRRHGERILGGGERKGTMVKGRETRGEERENTRERKR